MEPCGVKNLISHVLDEGLNEGLSNYQMECGLARVGERLSEVPHLEDQVLVESAARFRSLMDQPAKASEEKKPKFNVSAELKGLKENLRSAEKILKNPEAPLVECFLAKGFLDAALVRMDKLRSHGALPPSLENKKYELDSRLGDLNSKATDRELPVIHGLE